MKRLSLLLGLMIALLCSNIIYAQCRYMGGHPQIPSGLNFHAKVEQNKNSASGIGNLVYISCSPNSRITVYGNRDTSNFQNNIDKLIDSLQPITNPQFYVGMQLIPGHGSGQVKYQIGWNFADKGGGFFDNGLPFPATLSGNWTVNSFPGHRIMKGDATSDVELNPGDIRTLVDLGGVRFTYSAEFIPDKTLPICTPKYFYHVDKTNLRFNQGNPVSGADLASGKTYNEDIRLIVARELNDACNDEAVYPRFTIYAPTGAAGTVVRPGDATNQVKLSNGTSIHAYQLTDSGQEMPLTYGSSYSMGQIGGSHGPNWSRNAIREIRFKWSGTPGENVETGKWRATARYEMYFL